jgi:hypothetical protein
MEVLLVAGSVVRSRTTLGAFRSDDHVLVAPDRDPAHVISSHASVPLHRVDSYPERARTMCPNTI